MLNHCPDSYSAEVVEQYNMWHIAEFALKGRENPQSDFPMRRQEEEFLISIDSRLH